MILAERALSFKTLFTVLSKAMTQKTCTYLGRTPEFKMTVIVLIISIFSLVYSVPQTLEFFPKHIMLLTAERKEIKSVRTL